LSKSFDTDAQRRNGLLKKNNFIVNVSLLLFINTKIIQK